MSGELLLSSATGFVGMEVLSRYLEGGDRRIVTRGAAQPGRGAGRLTRASCATGDDSGRPAR